jgi:hypothetical protein
MVEAGQEAELYIWPRYFLILLAPLSVLIGFEGLLHALGDKSPHFALRQDEHAALVAELVGRYRFMAAFAFSSAVSVSIILIFWFDVRENFARSSRRHIWRAFGALAIAAVVFKLAEGALGTQTHHLLGEDFLERALAVARVNLCVFDCPPGSLIVRSYLSHPTNFLIAAAACASLVGLVMSLAQPWDHTSPASALSPETQAAALRDGERIARRYLFCLGALLTAGMAFLLSWMHWPAELIEGTADRASYRELVAALSLYSGVGYSVLIASVYLPVMLIQAGRTDKFKRRVAGMGQKAEGALEVPQLSYVEALNRLVAVLSPLLASAVGSVWQDVLFG